MKMDGLENLLKLLYQIRSNHHQKELMANQFLNISKPTPENLAAYNFSIRKLDIFQQIFWFVFNSIRSLLLLVKANFFFKNRKVNSTNFVRSLFISHFFTNYLNRTFDSDPFFGQLPNISRQSGVEPEILYINQDNLRFRGQLIANRSGSKYRILGINSFDLGYIGLFTKNLILAVYLFIHGLKISNKVYRSIHLRVAVSQISVGTIRNLIISRELVREIKSSKVKEIWLTLEGHAYERSIVSTIFAENLDVQINLYQHAAITPTQLGIFELLNDFGDRLQIFTSGKITLEYFKRNFPNLIGNLHIAGSNKATGKIDHAHLPDWNSRKFLLFAPEGTAESALTMSKMAIRLARSQISIKPVIRFHPNTPFAAVEASRFLLKESNVEISSLNLSDDFKRAFACVYRSSATVIESLGFGVLPVCFAPEGGYDLDCLSISTLIYPKVDSAESLIELLGKIQFGSSCDYFSSREDFENYSRNYFMPWVSCI